MFLEQSAARALLGAIVGKLKIMANEGKTDEKCCCIRAAWAPKKGKISQLKKKKKSNTKRATCSHML